MKTIAKGILTFWLLIVSVGFIFGQTGVETGTKYGKGQDSIDCLTNNSLYREYFKQGNYEFAYEPWKSAYLACPESSLNLYLDGIKMIQKSIKGTEDPEAKKVLLDSMLRIYDKRVKYKGREDYVAAKKAVDYVKYAPKTPENLKYGYELLGKALEMRKGKAAAAEIATYFSTSVTLYKMDAAESGQVINDFGRVMEIIEAKLAKKPNDRQMNSVKGSVEKLLEESGALNCDVLVEYYTPKFNAEPENLEQVEKIHGLLSKVKCKDSDFYTTVTEKLNHLQPTAGLSYELGKIYLDNEKFDLATSYYKKAIELEEDTLKITQYYLELGNFTYRKLQKYAEAKSYALEATKVSPEKGEPYILIAHIYAAGGRNCFEDDFEKQTIYWAVVDKLQKAKQVDPSLADQVKQPIIEYTKQFPNNELIFFKQKSIGQSYTIGCWINETTKIRASDK